MTWPVTTAEREILVEAALLDPVHVGTDRPALADRSVQQLATGTAIHASQHASICQSVEILAKAPAGDQLEVRHDAGAGQVFANIGANAGQVAGRSIGELVIVVQQVGAEVAAEHRSQSAGAGHSVGLTQDIEQDIEQHINPDINPDIERGA